MPGNIEGRMRRGWQDEIVGWYHRLGGLQFEQLWKLVMDREAWHAAIHGVEKSWTWLSDWIQFYMLMSGLVYSIHFEEGLEIARDWATAHSLVFWQCLGTIMAPLCVAFSLLIEDQGLVGLSAISDPFYSNRFMLCPWAMSFLSKVVPCPFASCYTWGQKKLDTTEWLSLHLVLASAR